MRDRYALPNGSMIIWDDEIPEGSANEVKNGHWFGSGTLRKPISFGYANYKTYHGNPNDIAKLLSSYPTPIRVVDFMIDVQRARSYFNG